MNVILIFMGGGLGSVLRYGLGMASRNVTSSFPLGTLLANVLAAILIGFLAASLITKAGTSREWYFIAVGLCGGLSTFSTFSLETVQLFQQGAAGMAVLNILLNVLVCLGAIYLIARAGVNF